MVGSPSVIVTPAQLGRRVRHVRRALGLSQAEMAIELGLRSRAQISRIETGARNVWPEELARIGRLGGVSTDHLLKPYHIHGEAPIEWHPDAPKTGTGAERLIGASRWLAEQVGWPGFRLHTHRIRRRAPAQRVNADHMIEETVRGMAQVMIDWMDSHRRFHMPYRRRIGMPGRRLSDLLGSYYGIGLYVADLGEGVRSGHCSLEELDAIVLSAALAEEEWADALLREQFSLLAPDGLNNHREAAGLWVEIVGAQLRDRRIFDAETRHRPPGRELAEQVNAALRSGKVTEGQMLELLGLADVRALEAFRRAAEPVHEAES